MTEKVLRVLDIVDNTLTYEDGETAVIAVEYLEDGQVKPIPFQAYLQGSSFGGEIWIPVEGAEPARTEDGEILKDTIVMVVDKKRFDEENNKTWCISDEEKTVTSAPFKIVINEASSDAADPLSVSDINKTVAEAGVTLSVNVVSRYADKQFAWYKDDVKVEGSENKTTLSLGNDVTKAGTYAVKAKAENKRGQFRRKAEKRITVGEVDLKPTEHQEVPPKGPGASPTDQHPDAPPANDQGGVGQGGQTGDASTPPQGGTPPSQPSQPESPPAGGGESGQPKPPQGQGDTQPPSGGEQTNPPGGATDQQNPPVANEGGTVATKLTLSQTNLGELTEGDVLNINAVPDKGNPTDLQNIQWYQLVSGQETPVAGQNTLNLNMVVGADLGTDIYVKAAANGVAVESDKAHVSKLRYKEIYINGNTETAIETTVLNVGQRLHLAPVVEPLDTNTHFRWEREVNGIRIPLASTEATLTIDPIALTDTGAYYLTVTRFDKTRTRQIAQLDVNDINTELPITVTLDQAGNINKPIGGTFTLTATANNITPAATYTWYRTPTGGQPAVVAGQTSNVLVISDLKLSDAGSYYVEVAEGVRAPVKSGSVYLNVIAEPTAEPKDPQPGQTDPIQPGNSQHTFTNLKIASFRNYANMMQPTKVIKPLEGLQWQIRLYHDLLDILKYPGVTVYMDAMDAAVDFFHHYSDTLFSMTNRARYLQLATDAELSKDEREALLEIFNVFASMADPAKNQRWELKEIYDILRDSTAYSRLVQYYDRKFMANLAADETGRQFE